ncbi:hypothetical protein ACLB2K_034512 [Fragaria x ananassa]
MSSRPEDQLSPRESNSPTTTVPDIHASQPPPPPPPPPAEEDNKKYGTHIMGAPAAPNVHPDNQKAALWNAEDHQQIPQQPLETQPQQPPYVQYSDQQADQQPLRAGPSVSETAWGKLNLTAKAVTEGGFEALFKQIFATDPNEKLKKTFACYLSTSTGPVAGTLYLSTARVAFCSDRPLTFAAPSGQSAWSYYKVMIPLTNVGRVNPVVITANPTPEKYLQIVTTDGHDFWFMGRKKKKKKKKKKGSISIGGSDEGVSRDGYGRRGMHHGAGGAEATAESH